MDAITLWVNGKQVEVIWAELSAPSYKSPPSEAREFPLVWSAPFDWFIYDCDTGDEENPAGVAGFGG